MAEKKCTSCDRILPQDQFVKKGNGYFGTCRPCRNTYLREYNRTYTKSKFGFLMRVYRNMLSRVTGVQAKKAHLYRGLPILPRESFYAWAESTERFHRLFAEWEQSGYRRTHTPTVDRIDSSRGYDLDNMEWVTHSENSRRGTVARNRKLTDAEVIEIRTSDESNNAELARRYGVSTTTIWCIRAGQTWKDIGSAG